MFVMIGTYSMALALDFGLVCCYALHFFSFLFFFLSL